MRSCGVWTNWPQADYVVLCRALSFFMTTIMLLHPLARGAVHARVSDTARQRGKGIEHANGVGEWRGRDGRERQREMRYAAYATRGGSSGWAVASSSGWARFQL